MGNDNISKVLNSVGFFDSIKFAQDVLNEVEAIRSTSQVTDIETKSRQQFPIESRLNAFYRLVGLPMFVKLESRNDDKTTKGTSGEITHLTPGYYGKTLTNYNITNDTVIGLFTAEREKFLKQAQQKIGTDETDEAMLKAIKSPIPLTATYPYLNAEDELNVAVSKENEVGSNTDFNRSLYKSLFPTATYYIDVQPVKNQVARPFLRLLKDQMPDNYTILPKPFIETVIRIRMISGANAEDLNGILKINEWVERLSNLNVDTSQLSYINTFGSLNTLEAFIVLKLLSSLDQIARRWVFLHTVQEQLFTKNDFTVSIRTTSSRVSPFGKQVQVSSSIEIDPKSSRGRVLQQLKKRQIEEEALLSLVPSDDTIYETNSLTAQTKNTSLMALTTPFTNLLSNNLELINKEIQKIENSIKKDASAVEKIRLEREMLTGEFSGLSVVDVIAIITGLFIIEEKHLISLLDTATKDEMRKDTRLKDAIESVGNPDGVDAAEEAINALEDACKFVFDALNALIQQVADKTKENKEAQSRKRDSKNSRRISYSKGRGG